MVRLVSPGRERRRLYVVCWVLLFGMGMGGGGVYPYIGPMAVQRFGASSLVIGLLFDTSSVTSMVGGPVAGLITDRLGGRRRRWNLLCCPWPDGWPIASA